MDVQRIMKVAQRTSESNARDAMIETVSRL